MSQPGAPPGEPSDEPRAQSALARPDLRATIAAVLAALLIIALSGAIFTTLAIGSLPQAAPVSSGPVMAFTPPPTFTPPAGGYPTEVPWSPPQSPIHGAGLPSGVQIIAFALTGPDEGWATGGANINPLYGTPDHSMIYRYSAGTWTQVGPTLPGYLLSGLYMDSPTDGWVMGGDANARNILLHISGGSWRQVSPPAVDPRGVPVIMRFRSPNDGWLVMADGKTEQGGASASLFHYQNGVWSLMRGAPYYITDLAPVAVGEAWITGWSDTGASQLFHIQDGVSSLALSGPVDSAFSDLRVFAPNDIWIEGAQRDATSSDIYDQPLIYHYNGARWSLVDLHAPISQHAAIVSATTAWGFHLTQGSSLTNGSTSGVIASIYSNAGGQWQTLSVPYKDLQSLEVVSQSSTDVWAIGVYMVTTQVSANTTSSVSEYVLLHYTNGTWTEYGR